MILEHEHHLLIWKDEAENTMLHIAARVNHEAFIYGMLSDQRMHMSSTKLLLIEGGLSSLHLTTVARTQRLNNC